MCMWAVEKGGLLALLGFSCRQAGHMGSSRAGLLGLAEAHAALAAVSWEDGKQAAAEESFEKATRSDPRQVPHEG